MAKKEDNLASTRRSGLPGSDRYAFKVLQYRSSLSPKRVVELAIDDIDSGIGPDGTHFAKLKTRSGIKLKVLSNGQVIHRTPPSENSEEIIRLVGLGAQIA